MVGEKILLKVSPMKGIMRFGKKGKLSPRFIGPFEVLKRVGEVAYELALPPSLSGVHSVFHISMLRKYHADLSHVLVFGIVHLDNSLGYEEESITIVDKQVRQLRSKKISVVKVQWRGQPVEEATWEAEENMRIRYPDLFSTSDLYKTKLREDIKQARENMYMTQTQLAKKLKVKVQIIQDYENRKTIPKQKDDLSIGESSSVETSLKEIKCRNGGLPRTLRKCEIFYVSSCSFSTIVDYFIFFFHVSNPRLIY
ncbi:uncharacterized protein [Nicotiana tomentosiformis]|uniref:uncharacterized protein n=1 Tax=Nicotiana tomentosiformis TaxID=4098 RepID=UPI00388CA3EF